MMCFKAIVLVSSIVCLISAEIIPLKERIFKCKLLQLKKHHSIFENIFPSIVSSPVDSAVPGEYTIPDGVTTVGTDPVPVPTAVPVAPQQEEQNPPPQEVQYPPQEVQLPPQEVQHPPQEVQYPPQEVQYPPQEVQYPPQEVQYPPQPEVQYPSQPEVQYPVPQQEGQPPAAPPQEVQNPPQQRPLYPPQHNVQYSVPQQEGQSPAAPPQEVQNSPQQRPLYPPQHNMQYYPLQNEGQYYPPQNGGVYYPPPNYQGVTTNNVPYNYPVYGQNVLRSVKSVDGQMYMLHQRPYRLNMLIRKPITYYNAPPVYDQYAASQYNYVPQAPRTAQALTKAKPKST